uniref:Uncharacterized protein n=1 Tax=Toxarium undulatum TaxID=210620 RepID=A0A2U9GIP5_9STRA|nr:hypothetical protein [Toxarium undulatum]AWQ64143.1 hypothetical protein [Toxarium undulatum]
MKVTAKQYKFRNLKPLIKNPLLLLCFNYSYNSIKQLKTVQQLERVNLFKLYLSTGLIRPWLPLSILKNYTMFFHGAILIFAAKKINFNSNVNFKELIDEFSCISLKLNNKMYDINQLIYLDNFCVYQENIKNLQIFLQKCIVQSNLKVV